MSKQIFASQCHSYAITALEKHWKGLPMPSPSHLSKASSPKAQDLVVLLSSLVRTELKEELMPVAEDPHRADRRVVLRSELEPATQPGCRPHLILIKVYLLIVSTSFLLLLVRHLLLVAMPLLLVATSNGHWPIPSPFSMQIHINVTLLRPWSPIAPQGAPGALSGAAGRHSAEQCLQCSRVATRARWVLGSSGPNQKHGCGAL